MREQLIRLAIQYDGNYFKIKKAVINNEKVDETIPLQQAVTIVDPIYPKELLKLQYPPFVLFYSGNIDLLKENKIAVVGSRNPSNYGKRITIDVVKQIKNRYVIVSGAAKGIDCFAQYYAEKTIAVIGNGLDVVYPKENKNLYSYLKAHQLIISEYPFGVQPQRYHFPFRNRIIAALADKIVVTQAAEKSGTMITVEHGLKLGKKIYCLPYNYDDPSGAGCNILISKGAIILDKQGIIEL